MRILKAYSEFINENVSKDAVKEWNGFYLWWVDDIKVFRIIALDEGKKSYPNFKDFEIYDMTKEEANILGKALVERDPMEWKDFLNQIGYNFVNENTNVDRSISGIGKFGMLDYNKMPEPFKNKLIEKGFKNTEEKYNSYGGSNVSGQVYTKNNIYDERDNELIISFFIEDDTKDLYMYIYVHNKEMTAFYNIPWKEYNKFIKVLDELDFNRFFHIEALDDKDQMESEVKKIADEYELSVSDFSCPF